MTVWGWWICWWLELVDLLMTGVGGSADNCLGLVDQLMTGGAAVCALMLSQLPLWRTHPSPLSVYVFSGLACNPSDPHWSLSFYWWRSFTVPGTKVAPFP
jgi:hypothetical protein